MMFHLAAEAMRRNQPEPAGEQAIATNEMLNGEVIRLNGAIRLAPK